MLGSAADKRYSLDVTEVFHVQARQFDCILNCSAVRGGSVGEPIENAGPLEQHQAIVEAPGLRECRPTDTHFAVPAKNVRSICRDGEGDFVVMEGRFPEPLPQDPCINGPSQKHGSKNRSKDRGEPGYAAAGSKHEACAKGNRQ